MQQEYVYLLLADQYGKIGCSLNPEQRLKAILHSAHPDLPCDPCLAHVIPVTMARRSEAALHRHFDAKRVEGEWFLLDGDDIEWLRQQSDATLVELANQFQLNTYAALQAPPKRNSGKKRVNINVRVDESFLEELQEIAKKDYRTVPNEIETILKWALPRFRAELEAGSFLY